MANISSLISLDAFVRRLLFKEGKDDDDYLRYMQIACEAIRNFHIHHFNVAVTKVVSVDSTSNTFDFPGDYVRYKFIATPIDGRWWTYTEDGEMAPLQDDQASPEDVQSSLPNIAEYNFYDSLGKAGGWNKYYFREDRKNRRFQVGGYTPDVVVLKYISNGIDSTGDINIPDYALLAIEDYVRWKIQDYNGAAQSEILRLEKQYKDSLRQMRQVFRPTLQEVKDSIYASSGGLLR